MIVWGSLYGVFFLRFTSPRVRALVICDVLLDVFEILHGVPLGIGSWTKEK